MRNICLTVSVFGDKAFLTYLGDLLRNITSSQILVPSVHQSLACAKGARVFPVQRSTQHQDVAQEVVSFF